MKKLMMLCAIISLIAISPLNASEAKQGQSTVASKTETIITVSTSDGEPAVSYRGADTRVSPGAAGASLQISDAETIVVFDLGDGIREASGTCGANNCFAWTTGGQTLILEQPSYWTPPTTTYFNGQVEIGASTETGGASTALWNFDILEHRSCRTCGDYPNHCGNLETWTCDPSNCPSCRRCTSRPC